MTRVAALQTRYQFAAPDAYAQMEQQGRFDVANLNRSDVLNSIYLWLHDVYEWWTEDEIRNYQPPSYHKPGFIPFASTGEGDFWCWYPVQTSEVGVPVIFCPHDDGIARVDAPDFTGWLYRRILEYAGGEMNDEDEAEARSWIVRWQTDLSPFFPLSWSESILQISRNSLWTRGVGIFRERGLIRSDECKALLTRDLAFDNLNTEFEWMN